MATQKFLLSAGLLSIGTYCKEDSKNDMSRSVEKYAKFEAKGMDFNRYFCATASIILHVFHGIVKRMMTISSLLLYNAPLSEYVYPILDVRRVSEFIERNIPTSICVSQFNSEKELLREIVRLNFHKPMEIILYNENGLDDSSLDLVKQYFDDQKNITFTLLQGGFQAFLALFPGLVTPGILPTKAVTPSYIPMANLYLGGLKSANAQLLNALGIKTILNAGARSSSALSKQFQYLKLVLEDVDTASLDLVLLKAVEFLTKNSTRGPLFVHCAMGVSRSVSCVCALLMSAYDMSFDDALRYVQVSRPIACPNPGFEKQLRVYEDNVKQKKRKINDTENIMLTPSIDSSDSVPFSSLRQQKRRFK